MNEKQFASGRRAFLKKSLLTLSAVPLLKLVGLNTPAFAQPAAPTKALDESDPMAKTKGYPHDVTKVDATQFPRVKDPSIAGGNCSSCMLFQGGGLKAEGQTGDWGRCTLFQNGLVNSKGWCNSYAKKVA